MENNVDLADLEKQVSDLEKLIGKARVESDKVKDAPLVKPKKPKNPRLSLHDNKATRTMDKVKKKPSDDDEDEDEDDEIDKALSLVEGVLSKVKKKPSDGDEDDDDDEIDKALEALNVIKSKKKLVDGDDDKDGDNDKKDNWSEESDKKKMKKLSSKEKKKQMKKNLEQPASFESDGESLTFDGRCIAKADIGDDLFGVIKAQSERITKAENDRQMAELRKRADDEYSHVAGSTDERASILKAIGGLSDPDRKAFEKVLQANEKLAKSAFAGVGFSGRGNPDDIKKNGADFLAKVNEIKARDKLDAAGAMTKARQEHPDLFKAYQGN